MSTLVTNIGALVVFPSLVVTGFLYAIYRSLNGLLDSRTISGTWTASVVVAFGLYFLGHPLYPGLVPLIRASTSWMYAIGGAYLTLGAYSVVRVRFWRQFRGHRYSAVGSWFAAILSVVVSFVAANGFEPRALVHLVGGNDIAPALYLSLPLAFLFALGYNHQRKPRTRLSLSFLLVFALYALVSANSIPLTERVRGPVTVVFVAFGCIGVLLGIPAYVLATTLRASSDEPEVRAAD